METILLPAATQMRQALIVTVLLALMAFIADRVVNWTLVNAVSVSMPNSTMLPAMMAASARNEGGSVGTLTGGRKACRCIPAPAPSPNGW